MKSPSTTYGPLSRTLIVTVMCVPLEDRILGVVMEVPLIDEAGEIHGHGVVDVDADLAAGADDVDVLLRNRQLECLRFQQQRFQDRPVIVLAGGARFVLHGVAHLGGFHFDGNHLVRDHPGDEQQDESEQAAETAFTKLAAIAHEDPPTAVRLAGQSIHLKTRARCARVTGAFDAVDALTASPSSTGEDHSTRRARPTMRSRGTTPQLLLSNDSSRL